MNITLRELRIELIELTRDLFQEITLSQFSASLMGQTPNSLPVILKRSSVYSLMLEKGAEYLLMGGEFPLDPGYDWHNRNSYCRKCQARFFSGRCENCGYVLSSGISSSPSDQSESSI